MISIQSRIYIDDLSASEVIDFFLNCTDEKYQRWWPGTHLALHTVKRTPNNIGNIIYMDEFVGRRRIRSVGIVTAIEPCKKVVWQFKKIIRLPIWLSLELQDTGQGVVITHTIHAGFKTPYNFLDPLFRMYLSEEFGRAIDEHVKNEFPKLRELLHGSVGPSPAPL